MRTPGPWVRGATTQGPGVVGAEGSGWVFEGSGSASQLAVVTSEARTWASSVGKPGLGRAAGVGRRGRCPRESLNLRQSQLLSMAVLLELFLGLLLAVWEDARWAGVKAWSGIGPDHYP